MRKKLKRISCLLLVVLCMASISITAFAAETEATEPTEPATAETDIGYKELPAFMKPENYLKNAEMQMEDDYGMIDDVINNGYREA